MKNQNEKYVAASQIVDTMVTTNDTYFMDYMFNNPSDKEILMMSIHQIHMYLESHDDLLSKKLIFFTQHETEKHWWGWVAIKPCSG